MCNCVHMCNCRYWLYVLSLNIMKTWKESFLFRLYWMVSFFHSKTHSLLPCFFYNIPTLWLSCFISMIYMTFEFDTIYTLPKPKLRATLSIIWFKMSTGDYKNKSCLYPYTNKFKCITFLPPHLKLETTLQFFHLLFLNESKWFSQRDRPSHFLTSTSTIW